jgi:hypothetical protein
LNTQNPELCHNPAPLAIDSLAVRQQRYASFDCLHFSLGVGSRQVKNGYEVAGAS